MKQLTVSRHAPVISALIGKTNSLIRGKRRNFIRLLASEEKAIETSQGEIAEELIFLMVKVNITLSLLVIASMVFV